MSERHDQVARMLAADAPAARDIAFEVAVMMRMEQRRYRRGMILNVALTVLATALLALTMPGLETLWQKSFAGLDNAVIAAILFAMLLPLQGWLIRRA